jgi:hypothetical protein
MSIEALEPDPPVANPDGPGTVVPLMTRYRQGNGRDRHPGERGSGMRVFDPRAVGALEARAWELYYRRRWPTLLVTAVRLVRAAFGMPWGSTLRGAWWVLRANQRWAPYPHNDRRGAEAAMTRFYQLVARSFGELLDPAAVARYEVAWWQAHRCVQHEGAPLEEIVTALGELYGFAYGLAVAEVLPAATLRAEAMVLSDRWVAEGSRRKSPLLAEERVLLVRSYAALLAAVYR